MKTEALQNIINQREKAKHEARVSLYLLETVLFISQKGNIELTIEKFQYLMAYANWLVVLSDDADMCHFTEKEVIVQVTPEYLIDIETGSGLKSMVEGLPKRMYDDPGFIERNYDEDKRCFEIVKEKFEQDTNIKLEHLLSFLYYLETGGAIGKELSFRNNIICFWKDDILSDFCKIEKISLGEGEKILHFVSIVTSKLKTKNGRTDCYLPIGEKEKRDNRYEVKPIYEYEGILSFAPVIIYSLREYWQNSIYEFCIPYEIGLPETKKALDAWKKVYEMLSEEEKTDEVTQ